MSSAMNKVVLLLICLACSSHGRRVQAAMEGLKFLKSDDLARMSNDVLADADQIDSEEKDADPAAQSFAEVNQFEKAAETADVMTPESDAEQASAPSHFSPQTKSENSFKSWFQSGYAALTALEDGHAGQSSLMGQVYLPLSVAGSAFVLIFTFCCVSFLLKCFVVGGKMESKYGNALLDLQDEHQGEHSDKKVPGLGVAWQTGASSLPVLSARLEAWDAKEAAEPVASPREEAPAPTILTRSITENSTESGDACGSGGTDGTSDADCSATEDLIAPVTMEPGNINPTLLTRSMAKSLLKYLPAGPRAGAAVWRLCYKPAVHGTSMTTLHRNATACERSLLLVRDTDDHVFGGFAPCPWKIGGLFHGTGEAFVFTFGQVAQQSHEAEGKEKEQGHSIKAFPWTEADRHFMYADRKLLAMGGGDGRCALAIHEGLLRGHSSYTPTFGNPPLSAVAGGDFVVKDVELWSLE